MITIMKKAAEAFQLYFLITNATSLQKRYARIYLKRLRNDWIKENAILLVLLLMSPMFFYSISVLASIVIPILLLLLMLFIHPRLNFDYGTGDTAIKNAHLILPTLEKEILDRAWKDFFADNNIVESSQKYVGDSYTWSGQSSHIASEIPKKGSRLYADKITQKPIVVQEPDDLLRRLYVNEIRLVNTKDEIRLKTFYMTWENLEKKKAITENFTNDYGQLRFLILSEDFPCTLIAGVNSGVTLEQYFILRGKDLPTSDWSDYKDMPLEWLEIL